MPKTTALPLDFVRSGAMPLSASRPTGASPTDRSDSPTLRIVRWIDPVADPHGVHPCSRYVELYWLGIIGPSTMQYEPVGTRFPTYPCNRAHWSGNRGNGQPVRTATQPS